MAKYSFKEECDNLDKLAYEMRISLLLDDTLRLQDAIWELAALAERMKRKHGKYHVSGIRGAFVKNRNLLENDCGK